LLVGCDELRQTHISWVFMHPEHVLKVKKPVSLGFLDFRTLAARQAACEAELQLNRRLAPSVYLRVVPIHRDAQGMHHVNGEGELVDFGVLMRRLPDADAADQRLRANRLTRQQLVSLAERLASFHRDAALGEHTARFGDPSLILANVRENFEQTRISAPQHLSSSEIAEIERYQLGFLDAHKGLFAERIAQGCVRDGHGDLRLEHVYLGDDGSLEVIDCIEFNERFRYADVCADLAFLSMDLVWHERSDLAETLLAAYARSANDFQLYRLVDFYESYRAYVRGKVESIVEYDETQPPSVRQRAAAQARKHYLLSLACAREPVQAPVLCAVGGMIAAGKSTLSDALGAELSVPVVDADRTRKHLASAAPTTRLGSAAFSGAYAPEASARVYSELLTRADAVLSSKRTVIVDASFRSAAERGRMRELAQRHGVAFVFVECRAPVAVCEERLRRRALGPSVSDAGPELLPHFMASYEAVSELPAAEHLALDGTQPLAENLGRVRERLALG
jgi:aminoglycoside phosphotransferase family enzyme/predicted kinase